MVENPAIYEWLISAGNDARAAMILHQAGSFPQGLYCLQQAVEKLNKAVGLWANFLEKKDFQKVSHSHDRLHDLALEQQEKVMGEFQELNIDFIGIFSEMITGEKVEMAEYNSEFAKLKNIRKTAQFGDIRELGYEQLEQFLSELESAPGELKFEIDKSNIAGSWNPMVRAMLDKIILDDEREVEPEEQSFMVDFIVSHTAKSVNAFYKVFPYFIQVHLLGFFTSPFAYTRYPDEAKGFNPVTAYTTNYPFVRLFPRFHKVASENIRRLTLLARIATPFSIPSPDSDEDEGIDN
ncbi:MAG: hypothetical protein V4557_12650 [Bacteroidota bacterium]